MPWRSRKRRAFTSLVLTLSMLHSATAAGAAAPPPRRKNKNRKNHRRTAKSSSGSGKHDQEENHYSRDLWQNPLWATPNTDLYWSAKEQPHYNDANWSANLQPEAPANSNSNSNSNPRPPGNPFENNPPPAAQSQSQPYIPPPRPSASNTYSYSRPAPVPVPSPPSTSSSSSSSQSQPSVKVKDNPWDNPTKYGASPSPPTLANSAPSRPISPPTSNNQNSVGGRGGAASSLISSAVQAGAGAGAGSSNNNIASSNTQQVPQQQQQQSQITQQVPQQQQQPEVTATYTSTITLSNIPTPLPTYGTQQYVTFIYNLQTRISSAIMDAAAREENTNNDSSSSSSLVEKITILSIGGVRVPSSRRHRHLEEQDSGDDGEQRSLQTATREVEYKAVLDYKCSSTTGTSCAENAQRLATSIANTLSSLLPVVPTPGPTRGTTPRPSSPATAGTASNNHVDNQGEESWVWLPTSSSQQANTVVQVITPTRPPTPRPVAAAPTPPPVTQFAGAAVKRFCGFGWKDVIQNCLTATPCPGGDADGVCPSGMSCIADTPCADSTWLARLAGESSSSSGSTSSRPTPRPVAPTPPVTQFAGAAVKRFCGFGWNDVIRDCLTATPCPGGDATGVCPSGMSCIADTPCADSTWLARLAGESSSSSVSTSGGSVQALQEGPSRHAPVQQQAVPMQSNNAPKDIMTMQFSPMEVVNTPTEPQVVPSSSSNTISCTSDMDCRAYNQFCAVGGNCVECLPGNNRGCRASEVCAIGASGTTPSCVARQVGPMTMSSSSSQQQTVIAQQQQVQAPPTTTTMLYQNPPDNTYFCGTSSSAITGSCLQSKPCPSGAMTCGMGEGCFYHPTCKTQYDSAASMSSRVSYGAFADIEDILLDNSQRGKLEEVDANADAAMEAKSGFTMMETWNSATSSTSSWQHLCLRFICTLSTVIAASFFW